MSPVELPIEPAGVAEVERTTGIARATLRIWERRYGFPNPHRDARGERFYDEAQIAKLRLIGMLTGRGHRPGRLIDLPTEALQEMANQVAAGPGRFGHEPLVQLMRTLDTGALTGWLLQRVAAMGLERFLLEAMPADTTMVGEAWACGELQIHEEHFYTECLQQVLRTAMAALPPAASGAQPRVLLATLAREQHGLGLLSVQALLALERCALLPLGVNLPSVQVAAAAAAWKAEVVALSFSQSYHGRDLLAGLIELRNQLEAEVEIWVGGGCAALERPEITALPRLRHLRDLPALEAAIVARRQGAG